MKSDQKEEFLGLVW